MSNKTKHNISSAIISFFYLPSIFLSHWALFSFTFPIFYVN